MTESNNKTVDDYVKQSFPILCKGRNPRMEECLAKAVNASVEVYKSPGSSMISTQVHCPHNTGGHGQRCKASHPKKDKVGEGVVCPYSLDIPYAIENKYK
jgi:hypothetical protein